jgi:signal transduction histidine kinase
MNQARNRLSGHYLTAIRKYLGQETRDGLLAALRLGRRAAALGWDTLDLARMHDQTLVALDISAQNKGAAKSIKRAEIFFTEAMTPILATHRAARESKIELNHMNKTLIKRTAELVMAHRRLQRGILRRKGAEKALKLSGLHYAKLLKDSLRLQEGLRQLTHRVLAAQDVERKSASHELQDEIAQTLMGVNVRLLSLKKEARYKTRGTKNEIANIQRLVIKSARSVRRVALKFGGL